MKTIGLIGGLSWESTALYYQHMNQEVKKRLGGLHSAKLIITSLNMHDIAAMQASGDWDGATRLMIEAATSLKAAGADAIIICTNTMHKMAENVEQASGLPLLHIVDATAAEIQRQDLKKVGLLATRFTMEQDFYRSRYQEKFGIEVILPDEAQRQQVHRIIYEELCLGQVKLESKAVYVDTINKLTSEGAEGVILGCTEIGMLIKPEDVAIPALDTTYLHAKAAVDYALN